MLIQVLHLPLNVLNHILKLKTCNFYMLSDFGVQKRVSSLS